MPENKSTFRTLGEACAHCDTHKVPHSRISQSGSGYVVKTRHVPARPSTSGTLLMGSLARFRARNGMRDGYVKAIDPGRGESLVFTRISQYGGKVKFNEWYVLDGRGNVLRRYKESALPKRWAAKLRGRK